MKFRTIFIAFNIIVAVCFAFLFISPAAVLGFAWTADFWARAWPLALFFLAVLAVLNVFFVRNARLFTLLEREDWPALSSWLEVQIHERGRISARNVRIQVNTLLLLSDSSSISRLERLLAEKKPALLERLALPFGTARLLAGDDASTEPFLARHAASGRAEGGDWLGFELAFCRVRMGKSDLATQALIPLLGSKDIVVRGLAAHFLSLEAPKAPDSQRLTALAEGLRLKLSAKGADRRWERACEGARQEIQGVVFSRFMEECLAWIRGAPMDERTAKAHRAEGRT